MSPDLRQDLQDATADLLYPSETDAEFEVVELQSPFPWEGTEEEVEELSVDEFFEALREGPDAARYHALYGVLFARLCDLAVHRVGQIDVQIYITGREREPVVASGCEKENRVGLKTHSVET